ncbi:hypothetical protein [Nocardioides piscis]|uniref:Uncharacterized protein n=1 Tax=Nocardioides piscis TaxID=2714938 RepID=A0A6G7YDX9_9ACTN|nr:hypothetical protein [Nocardioides piscis]QIK74886.1 hypothetical protein G7071_05030 [Nocardioides piscis]
MDDGFDQRSEDAPATGTAAQSQAPGRHAGPRDPEELQAEQQLAAREAKRRTSSLEEVRDGGFGMGSAAPLDDGAMPLGHPVKAWKGIGAVNPGDPGYDGAEPDVWFTDRDTAESAGFSGAD